MKRLIIFSLTLSLTYALQAQDTMRIDVVKPFIATLSDAMKIQSNPNPEVPQVRKDSFVYNSPEMIMADQPTGYTIKPLSLGTSLLPKLRNNYIKLGFGNYTTPLAEVYLNTTRNRTVQAGTYLKHLSSSPGDKRIFLNDELRAWGKKFIPKGIIDGEVSFLRNDVNNYGYYFSGTSSLPTIQNAPEPPGFNNVLRYFTIGAGYANVQKDTSKLGYALRVLYNRTAANYNITENDFTLSGEFRKSVQGNPLKVYTAVQTNSISATAISYGRTFIDINPTYRMLMNKAYLQVGFNSTFFSDSSGSTFHFFPKAEAGYSIINNALTAFGGIRGDLKRPTLSSITRENPFVRNFVFQNTLNQFELYAGIKGIISAQTSFMIEIGLASVKYLQFYGADSTLRQQKMIYDNSTSSLTHIRAELNHEFGEQFRFGFVMNYLNYSISLPSPYSMPTFSTSWNMLYNMSNKFFIRSEIYTMNSRTARVDGSNGISRDVSIGSIIDLNAGIDYRYNRNVKVFLNINNLTNNQYQRWVDMPVLGVNVVGGLGITF